MDDAPEFPDLLRLIDERSRAFRAAIATAPNLDVKVPTCPAWTLFDLAEHLGTGRRSWAATVAAGPDATGRSTPTDAPTAPRDPVKLTEWLGASTEELIDALSSSGPDQGCWTWWGDSQSPRTTGAVARHQLQEIAVHTYDAQFTAGEAQPLPPEIALDGVEEFQFTCCATTSPWPHEPAVIDYVAAEGPCWRLRLSADGARISRHTPAPDQAAADVSARGTASDLVLVFYGRLPLGRLHLDGDRQVLDRLVAWDPDA